MENQNERRTDRRSRTLKGGRIVFNGGYGVAECTVRNLSSSGALIEFAGILPVPSEFVLHVDSEHHGYPCRVTWRAGTRMGVAFTGPPEEIASHHPAARRRDQAY